MRDSLTSGALTASIDILVKSPLDAGPDDVLTSQAMILGTPENLGYMSGALKDFFDRIYYPCLEQTQGLSYALYVRAGQSMGIGCCRAVTGITKGLRWNEVQKPLVCSGPYHPNFLDQCYELGQTMAAGLEMGIY
jgi:multimeric flavodoxin WrbA